MDSFEHLLKPKGSNDNNQFPDFTLYEEKIYYPFIELDFEKSLYILNLLMMGYSSNYYENFVKFCSIKPVPNPIQFINVDKSLEKLLKKNATLTIYQQSFLNRMLLFESIFKKMNFKFGSDSLTEITNDELMKYDFPTKMSSLNQKKIEIETEKNEKILHTLNKKQTKTFQKHDNLKQTVISIPKPNNSSKQTMLINGNKLKKK